MGKSGGRTAVQSHPECKKSVFFLGFLSVFDNISAQSYFKLSKFCLKPKKYQKFFENFDLYGIYKKCPKSPRKKFSKTFNIYRFYRICILQNGKPDTGSCSRRAKCHFSKSNMANRGKVEKKIKKNFKNCPKSPRFTVCCN